MDSKKLTVKKLFDIFLCIISITGFLIMCYMTYKSWYPWIDEVNAWNISHDLSFIEYFKVAKYEGHMFLWYTILSPFAKNEWGFPSSLYFANFIFLFGSIILLWLARPLNSLMKTLITFSFPIRVFSKLARCYSIGLFFLFSIASLYPKRLKHPLFYSFLIILAANTSVMALVGAFIFGLAFLYDIIKEFKNKLFSKKDLILTLSILLFGAILILIQLGKSQTPMFITENPTNYNSALMFFSNFQLRDKLYYPSNIFTNTTYTLITMICLIMLSPVVMKKNKQPLFFLFGTIGLLTCIFSFVYGGQANHHSFIYIYIIIAMWLFLSEYKIENIREKIYTGIFMLFLLGIFFNYDYKYVYSGQARTVFKEYITKHQNDFQNHKIFFFPSYSYSKEVIPYLYQYNLQFYDSHGNNLESLEAYKVQWKDRIVDFDKIADMLNENETAYFFTTNKNHLILELSEKSNKNKNKIQVTNEQTVSSITIQTIKKAK